MGLVAPGNHFRLADIRRLVILKKNFLITVIFHGLMDRLVETEPSLPKQARVCFWKDDLEALRRNPRRDCGQLLWWDSEVKAPS